MSDASRGGSAARSGIPRSLGAGFALVVAVLVADGVVSAVSLRTLAPDHDG